MNNGLKDLSSPADDMLGFVVFNGTKDLKNTTSTSNTDRLILAASGVERVQRLNTGSWVVHCGFEAQQYLGAVVCAKTTSGNIALTSVSDGDTGLRYAKRVYTHLIDVGATSVSAFDPTEVTVVLFGI